MCQIHVYNIDMIIRVLHEHLFLLCFQLIIISVASPINTIDFITDLKSSFIVSGLLRSVLDWRVAKC